MPKPPNIFLVGPMGAGKTTVGQLLAEHLSYKFYDSDYEIEAIAGKTIVEIFADNEMFFRELEEQVIKKLTSLSHVVLATGGGAVFSVNNRTALAAHGTVIYLQVTLEQQLARLANCLGRPLLQTANPAEKLQELQLLREPFYQGLADMVISTNQFHPYAIVENIISLLK